MSIRRRNQRFPQRWVTEALPAWRSWIWLAGLAGRRERDVNTPEEKTGSCTKCEGSQQTHGLAEATEERAGHSMSARAIGVSQGHRHPPAVVPCLWAILHPLHSRNSYQFLCSTRCRAEGRDCLHNFASSVPRSRVCVEALSVSTDHTDTPNPAVALYQRHSQRAQGVSTRPG